MHISIIIPAYNEEDRIGVTLDAVSAYVRAQPYQYEIIVVNDGSTDATAHVVEEAAKRIPHLRLIDNKTNHGKGWVVRQGILNASGRYRLFMDADGSTSIDMLDRLLPHAVRGDDVVVGSRRIQGARIEVRQNWFRDFLGGVFRIIVSLIVPVGIKDTQNGFKLFTAEAAEDIFYRQRTFTWAFDVEILAIARALGYSVQEVPIVWVNDGRSRVTLAGMVRMLFEVLEIRLNLWLGVYSQKVAEEIRVV